MANITSIGGNPIVPAAVQNDTITDAMLKQTGGVLENLEVVDTKVTVMRAGNICPYPTATRTSAGVTYTPLGSGGYKAEGTASSSSYYQLVNSTTSFPIGMKAGGTYYVDFTTDNLNAKIQIRYAKDGSYSSFDSITINHNEWFTIPDDAEGLRIWFYVNAGTVVDSVLYPKIYDTGSIEYARVARNKSTRPMLSIIYDDGMNDFKTYILPIIESKNVPIATAVIPEEIGSHNYLMSWDDIVDCYERGAEVLTHFGAYSEQEWASFTSQELSARYYKCRNAIINHGISTPNVIVFSGASSRRTVSRKAAMRIFDGGFNASNGGINRYGHIDPFFINRYSADDQTLATLKEWVDALVQANDGWMVWTRHNSSSLQEDQPTAAQTISDAIDYALSLGVQIVTVERGLAEYLDIH